MLQSSLLRLILGQLAPLFCDLRSHGGVSACTSTSKFLEGLDGDPSVGLGFRALCSVTWVTADKSLDLDQFRFLGLVLRPFSQSWIPTQQSEFTVGI